MKFTLLLSFHIKIVSGLIIQDYESYRCGNSLDRCRLFRRHGYSIRGVPTIESISTTRVAFMGTTTILCATPVETTCNSTSSEVAAIATFPNIVTTNNKTEATGIREEMASSNDDNATKNPMQVWLEQNIFMGIPVTPEILAIVTIYFVEGALGLARLARSYLLKDNLHLGPAELSALTGLFALPWTIKPVYGFLSDGFPLFGYQRKSYLIAAGILGGCAYGILSYEPFWNQLSVTAATQGTIAALLLGSACIAFSDVVADGIVVTRTREMAHERHDDATASANTAGGLQSLCWGASAFGGLLSAYFSGSLLEIISVRSIFGITAVLPLLVALTAISIDEEQVVTRKNTTSTSIIDGVREQVNTLWEAFQESSIWKPTLFIFLWKSTPTSDGAFFYFLTNDLLFGPEFLGRVQLVTAGAGLLGVLMYNQYFKTIPIKNILFWSTLISVPLGLLPVLLITHVNRDLGIPDSWLIFGDDVALAVLGTVAFMPTLVLAARLCPPGIEAVLFATLMSIYNGAPTVGTGLGALLTKLAGITESNFDNLALLTVVCNLSSLWPLVFIGWLDEVGDITEAELESPTKELETSTKKNDV
jgi:folate/biopterin transporter